jgi:hypothetical protein
MLRGLPPRDKNERINFVNDGPGRGAGTLPENPIDETHRTIFRRGPARREQAGIVEGDNTIIGDKRGPVPPIALDGFFVVIAINEKKINRLLPLAHGVVAEGLDPNRACCANGIDGPLRGAFEEIKGGDAREMERINKIECALWVHGFAQTGGGSSLGNANLDNGLRIARVAHQGFVLGQSVLRKEGPQPGPGKEGMAQKTGRARRGKRGNLRELDA